MAGTGDKSSAERTVSVGRRLPGSDDLGARHLRELLIADRVTTSIAAAALVILMVTTEINVAFVLLITIVVVMGLLRQVGLRSLAAGRTDAAVQWFALGSWGVSLGAVWIIPIALPILVITLAIPAVLAAIYLSDRQVRRITVGLVVAAGAAGAIARWGEGAGLEDRLNPNLVSATFVAFLAAQNLPLVMAVRQASRQHRTALAEALLAREAAQQARTEVTRSRARLARVTDIERRKIERDLHDGAQQLFVSALLELRVADESVRRGRDLPEGTMSAIADGLETGIDELHRLARGIYPSLLQARGLWEALHGLARGSAVPSEVIGEDPGRLPNETETALYFFTSEALQNVAKHAGKGATATIRLTSVGDEVTLAVADDGVGFEAVPEDAASSGVTNMRDRIAAVGGTTTFITVPAGGTEVTATTPRTSVVDVTVRSPNDADLKLVVG